MTNGILLHNKYMHILHSGVRDLRELGLGITK